MLNERTNYRERKYNKETFCIKDGIKSDNEFYCCNKILPIRLSDGNKKVESNLVFKVSNCFHHIEISFSLDFLLAKCCRVPALFFYLFLRFPTKIQFVDKNKDSPERSATNQECSNLPGINPVPLV